MHLSMFKLIERIALYIPKKYMSFLADLTLSTPNVTYFGVFFLFLALTATGESNPNHAGSYSHGVLFFSQNQGGFGGDVVKSTRSIFFSSHLYIRSTARLKLYIKAALLKK